MAFLRKRVKKRHIQAPQAQTSHTFTLPQQDEKTHKHMQQRKVDAVSEATLQLLRDKAGLLAFFFRSFLSLPHCETLQANVFSVSALFA